MKPLEAQDPETLGPYRLVARLGAGGMGRVYLARSVGGRTVAVKAIRAELAEDSDFRARFRREVEAARSVDGAYTAPVVDADPEAATPWLATAYVLGPSLADAVAEHGPLPEETVRALGAGLAEALAAVHTAGLVHRDLKPSNVLLAADGPRVIDFGIARAVDGNRLTQTGIVVGSPGYMCPEQATGQPMGPAGDVFSLGSVLVFAATGNGPFGDSSAAALLYQVVHGEPDLTLLPESLRAVIAPCLAKDPAARPAPAQLSAALAPGGAEQRLRSGWLPVSVSSAIARHAAAVMDLDTPASGSAPAPAADPRVLLAGAPAQQMPAPLAGAGPVRQHQPGSPATVQLGRVPAAPPGYPAGYPGGYPAGPGTAPAPSAGGASPSRRRLLAAAASVGGVAVVGGGTAFLLTRGKDDAGGSSGDAAKGPGTSPAGSAPDAPAEPAARPDGVAPTPVWTYSGTSLTSTRPTYHNGTILVNSEAGIVCLDAADGTKPKWVYEGVSNFLTSPVLSNGAVVALDGGTTIVGIDPAKGIQLWRLKADVEHAFDFILGTDDTAVYITGRTYASKNGQIDINDHSNTVFCVDLVKQKFRWKVTRDVGTDQRLAAVVSGRYLVYTDDRHNVTVRDTATGRQLWTRKSGGQLEWIPSVQGSTVFVGGDHVTALDIATGTVRWRVQDQGVRSYSSTTAVGDTVYCTGTGPGVAGVFAYSAADGSRRWFSDTGLTSGNTPATVSGTTVFVADFTDRRGLHALDIETGKRRWDFTDGKDKGGIDPWELSSDSRGHLIAQHYDRVYLLPDH
ncbi:protein kinase domain-containing protein [Peterkaempfera bronchialis]|uniref:Tat pathway signal protein n=1 Tax=Peterkaempfera bronchialis TaxID=2126346 RepID=A0A345SV97_9ACTN|nr:PQQ-binding-like beta-propeller repeat protein [Peterkaempfera bronchialis]AXI77652.1 Tat pathway signal protein [Peterkaempfera bronchialis]